MSGYYILYSTYLDVILSSIVPISRVFRESALPYFSWDYRLNFNFMIWEGNIYISRDVFFCRAENERLKLIAPSFFKLHPQAIDLISALNKVIKAISMSWGGIL